MRLDYNQLIALGTTYGMPVLKALAIGWVIAKTVSLGAKKLLNRTDLDNKLANYVTGGRTAGVALEAGVGKLIYWLILLFVLMAVFQTLGLTVVT